MGFNNSNFRFGNRFDGGQGRRCPYGRRYQLRRPTVLPRPVVLQLRSDPDIDLSTSDGSAALGFTTAVPAIRSLLRSCSGDAFTPTNAAAACLRRQICDRVLQQQTGAADCERVRIR
ncbi:unnamed protein product [Cuscuta campestris]|uniref:Uncharacterized protein n=1 Tax=Cuscuta campestris TaxID=132261 RepID=A0A484KCC4_9ASTE|nr:unnamed protein product [Cuscuta campestris]